MNNCKTCKWWIDKNNEYCHPTDEDTYKEKEMPFEVQQCKHPKLLFFERPVEINGFTVADGSGYFAALYTAENFGCILHEESEAENE